MVASDAELARAAQCGDPVSLGMLLERHRARIYGLALHMLGHGPDVEDAVQEPFLVALSTIDRLREPQAVGGWLRGILRNVCLTRLKQGRRRMLPDEPPRRVEARLTASLAEEAVDRLALREWVWTAMGELPDALRATAMLRYFSEYSSYEELAVILGVPVGTVRSRLNQARLKLVDALLTTAACGHDVARQLAEIRTRYFAAAWDEYSRGESYDLFLSAFAEDAVVAFPEGSVRHGRDRLPRDFEGDVEAGIKVYLTNLLACRNVTAIDVRFENPPDDPCHCPPAVSLVGFSNDAEEIDRMRVYFPIPTPERLLTM